MTPRNWYWLIALASLPVTLPLFDWEPEIAVVASVLVGVLAWLATWLVAAIRHQAS